MSKGSAQRPDDGKYQDSWDRIFGAKKPRREEVPLRDCIPPEDQASWDERMKQLEEGSSS